MVNGDKLVPNAEMDQQDLMRINAQLKRNDPEFVSNLPAS